MIFRMLLFVGLAVAATGCQVHSLTRQQISTLVSVDVVVCVDQSDLFVTRISTPEPVDSTIKTSSGKTDTTASAIVGVIGAVVRGIDRAQRQRELDERARLIRQALAGYDFRAVVLEAARTELAKVTSVQMSVRQDVQTNCQEPIQRVILDRSTAVNLLFYSMSYMLTESGEIVLSFGSSAIVYSKSNALHEARARPDPGNPVATGNAIYFQHFHYDVPYDGRRDVREIFRSAAFALAAKLAADFNKP